MSLKLVPKDPPPDATQGGNTNQAPDQTAGNLKSQKVTRPLPIIAIDGPAGAGKSTAARFLAYQLGFRLIDTGALYRTLALNALERNLSLNDGPALKKLCQSLSFQFGNLDKPSSELLFQQRDQKTDQKTEAPKTSPKDWAIPKLHVFCDGVDVTDAIRTPELGMAASNVSKLPEVREALLEIQRNFGTDGGIVMEGRDIGTVIFPDAEIKFYLDATVRSRAERRWEELKQSGVDRDLELVERETQSRDEQDMNRKVAPLKKALDSRLIDSTSRNLNEVVTEMVQVVRDYLKK